MRIIFWGTPEYSIASLDIFIKSKHEVIGVVSQPDKKRSRGNKLISSPVKSFAEQESIKIYTPAKIRDNIHFINESHTLVFIKTFLFDSCYIFSRETNMYFFLTREETGEGVEVQV